MMILIWLFLVFVGLHLAHLFRVRAAFVGLAVAGFAECQFCLRVFAGISLPLTLSFSLTRACARCVSRVFSRYYWATPGGARTAR
jgi:hypothetical protein